MINFQSINKLFEVLKKKKNWSWKYGLYLRFNSQWSRKNIDLKTIDSDL